MKELEENQKKSETTSKNNRHASIGSARPSQRRTEGQTQPCKVCSTTEWEEDISRGETYCLGCGSVAEENAIDPGAEWTNHSDGQDRSRVGAPMRQSLSDKGLNTTIHRGDLTSAGAKRHGINGKKLRDLRRQAVIDERSKTRSSRARNLTKAFQFIRDRGNLPPRLTEEAAALYRKAAEMNLVAGRSIRGVSAACVYLAAREANLPRTIEEVGEQFDMTSIAASKELKRTIRLVSRHLGTHRITSPAEYLDVFHSKLGLPAPVLGEANYLWERVGGSLEWQGKKPAGVAGVILYKASQNRGHPRTQAEVCKVATVSEVTLRGLLRILDALLAHLGEAPSN
ncbi:MAG: TFIIB-type zinc ribbon-containing protein [Candidatus Thalassarchaeaceae archaeon]|nr:TFIIB-type zinc ribbon-containing protein [Candidatus Thalassarchaeaceae archaeon]